MPDILQISVRYFKECNLAGHIQTIWEYWGNYAQMATSKGNKTVQGYSPWTVLLPLVAREGFEPPTLRV